MTDKSSSIACGSQTCFGSGVIAGIEKEEHIKSNIFLPLFLCNYCSALL